MTEADLTRIRSWLYAERVDAAVIQVDIHFWKVNTISGLQYIPPMSEEVTKFRFLDNPPGWLRQLARQEPKTI
ncbi:MAG: hypothetical protein ACAF41_12595 [Leptolyngbya sp. BL-A-14]